ncbi:hypothetical protein L1049_019212 [Liquidambar formosana]|uniref:GATA-type domain-containing protein n=1 Tax=Liquidambar formosana TaxID=63359 RepID=A0AAP0RB90_LIQFO
MTPIYLNPPHSPFPIVELKEDPHIQLFIPPNQDGSSCPTFFNTTQYHNPRDSNQHEHKAREHMVYKYISHGESSDRQVLTSSSLWPMADDSNNGHKLSVCIREDRDETKSQSGSLKWMSSKMRLMRKMMNSNCAATDKAIRFEHKLHDHQHGNGEINFSDNSNNTIRVCADCNTTKTPLWRGGPRGPKSLCNACGIRQRKARRAMAAAAAAANGTEIDTESSSTKTKVINKEKKSRTVHVTQYKKQCKLPANSPPDQSKKKLCFEDFALNLNKNSAFQRVFPQDEEEGAILLMALSYGLIHN